MYFEPPQLQRAWKARREVKWSSVKLREGGNRTAALTRGAMGVRYGMQSIRGALFDYLGKRSLATWEGTIKSVGVPVQAARAVQRVVFVVVTVQE